MAENDTYFENRQQTSVNNNTGHETIAPKKDTTASRPPIDRRWSVWLPDQTVPISRYGAPSTAATTISSPSATR